MSDNPTNLSVLFGGEIYRAGELPRRYLPFMLATTLTEPVWPLFCLGLAVTYLKLSRRRIKDTARPFQALAVLRRKEVTSLGLILLWFVVLVTYVLLRKPAMYDGLRHFLFILPPIFIFTGFAFEFILNRIAAVWLHAGLIGLLILPGITTMIQLHPYEYTYYNSFVGGTSGAFRRYETDYWLTCYKDAVESLQATVDHPPDLYVHREAYIAEYYAGETMNIHELRGALDEVKPGDYVLINTRTNEDRRVFRDAAPVLQIGRGEAIFCMIKQIP